LINEESKLKLAEVGRSGLKVVEVGNSFALMGRSWLKSVEVVKVG